MKIHPIKTSVILFLFVTLALLPLALYGQMEIIIAGESGNSNLDLTISKTDLLVATITEICTASGYTVAIESTNGVTGTDGLLKGAHTNNTDTIAYSMKYNSISFNLSGGTATITDSVDPTSTAGLDKILQISYTGSSSLTGDSYSDTLTITIAAK